MGEKSRAKKKPAKKVEWRRMPEAEGIVQDLIDREHKHLERAKMVVLGKPKASKVHGKVNVAKAKRATKQIQTLVKELAGEDLHYLIEVGLDAWNVLDSKARRIVLDHELCHFAGQDLETGKWGLIAHDVEEFHQIVRRHGAWTHELEQMKLDLGAA